MRDEYVESFINFLTTEGAKSENTIQSYCRDLRQAAEYFASQGMHMYEVKNYDIDGYVEYLKDKDKSDATIGRCISAMRTFYKYMMDNSYMNYNPAMIVTIPKIKRRRKAHGEDLMIPQGNTPIIIRDRAIVKLIEATGIKATALINLTIYDKDLMNRYERGLIDEYLKARDGLVKDKDTTELFVNAGGSRLTRQGLWKILNNYRTGK